MQQGIDYDALAAQARQQQKPPVDYSALAEQSRQAAAPPPKPTSMVDTALDIGKDVLRGFDPRTPTGRSNLAGGAGAAATLALTRNPSAAAKTNSLIRAAFTVAPVVGAYVGGAAEAVGERAVGGGPPSPLSLKGMAEEAHHAGTVQAKNEALGQVVAWPLKAFTRRVMAGSVAKRISSSLSEALDAVKARAGSMRPSVTPSQAGRMVEDVVQGPVKSVKDQLGEAVAATAKAGPALSAEPLRAKLTELAEQITPFASHEQLPELSVRGQALPPEQVRAALARNPDLALSVIPPDHPLPGVLSAVREALTDVETVSFEDAHKVKRLLDEAVNWESPARKQVQQITKGFRTTLRDLMATHKPYNEATGAYRSVVRLETRPVQRLHREILSNPEGLVKSLDWDKPSSAQLLKDLTTQVPKQGDPAGAQQGEAAWNAVRAAWTHENLVARGPGKMAAEIRKIEASGSGQEFVRTMYGDPQGQTVWQNLKQLGDAFETATQRVKDFPQSDIVTHSTESVRRDLAYAVLPGHSITKLGAVSRIISGPNVKDMIQWASYSDARTKFLVNHVLTGPNPGVAMADFMRWWEGSQGSPGKPVASHAPTTAQAGPPPQPTAR